MTAAIAMRPTSSVSTVALTAIGSTVTNLRFGDAVPGGKHSFTWIRRASQAPNPYAHVISNNVKVADDCYWKSLSELSYPLCLGHNYLSFQHPNLHFFRPIHVPGRPVKVTVHLRNTDARAGVDVAQPYFDQKYGTSAQPIHELKGP